MPSCQTVREDDDVCNVAATVNHSLAFTVSYGIARSAFSDDAPAGKNLLYVHVQCLSLSVLTAIFQVNLGQPVPVEAKDDGSGSDNWSYKSCKAPVKSSPLTNQHQFFYRPDAFPVTQPTVSKH